MASSKHEADTSSSRALMIPRREDNKARSSSNRSRASTRYDSLFGSGAHDLSSSSLSSDTSVAAQKLPHRQPNTNDNISHTSPSESRLNNYSTHSPTSSTFSDSDYPLHPPTPHYKKHKTKSVKDLDPPNTMPSSIPARNSPLGPNMLSNQTYKSVNLNSMDPDEPPRLITFTKAGQGFTWNEEIFLPSYLVERYSKPRRRGYDGDFGEDEIEVAEIFVTDEEAMSMMP